MGESGSGGRGSGTDIGEIVDGWRTKGRVARARSDLAGISELKLRDGVSVEVQDAWLNLRLAQANLASAQRDHQVERVNPDWVAGTLDGGPPPSAPETR